MPGASVRNSAHGKGHEEGGLAYAKAWSSLRKPPVPKHPTPKPESVSCSHLHLWLYGGLSPITISLGEGVNLQLQLIKTPGLDKSVSTWNSSGGPLASLIRFVRPHVIVYSLPTMRGMRCFRLTKGKFLWEVGNCQYSGLVRNYIGEGFFHLLCQ